MGDFDESRATHGGRGGDGCRHTVRQSDPRGEANQRLKNIKLLRRLMQSATGLAEHLRGHVGANHDDGSMGLKTFQQRRDGKQVPGTGRSKDGSGLAAAAIETISGKNRGLLMADDPVMKLRLLSQRVV